MPSVAVKLYSVFFKFLVKQRLQNRIQNMADESSNEKYNSDSFGVTTRPEESVAASNPVFTDGVATKDTHIDAFTSLSVRIFLPDTALSADPEHKYKPRVRDSNRRTDGANSGSDFQKSKLNLNRRNTFDPSDGNPAIDQINAEQIRRNSYGCVKDAESMRSENGVYRGYLPSIENKKERFRKLPVMVQFHGGGFVNGSNDSVANDLFCRRIAKLCDVMVLAVGYRLAPENKYPAAFEDGWKVLNWLAKQANLAECCKSMVAKSGLAGSSAGDSKKSDAHRHMIIDTFGASMVEPWLAAHGDPSR